MNVVLINPYEIGRQPFGLAEPAALLREAGCEVGCLDLSLQKLTDASASLAGADMVGIYVAMHTATRIALEALPAIKKLAPHAHFCVYGLYAPMNEALLRELGVQTVLGGEFEPALLSLIERLRNGQHSQSEPVISHARVAFVRPERSELPPLERYARLLLPDGGERTVGFVETTRGCKHLCSHCPVVPVYQGHFRTIPREIVLADIRQQVAAGAEHISFGDPDFFNGPTHARRVLSDMRAEFGDALTFDCTIKIQHLLEQAALLPLLRDSGCLFVTSAVESLDETILGYFRKQHSAADFEHAVELTRQHDIALAPTFVAFTPWTTLSGYRDLLRSLVRLQLVASVPPVQLSIRLLVPEGSYLLREQALTGHLQPFEHESLGYPWVHPDPRVDTLQQRIQALVESMDERGLTRNDVFTAVWALTHEALGERAPQLHARTFGEPIAQLSEQWYCCAEPTSAQLLAF